jgi:dienelactone hydrolase
VQALGGDPRAITLAGLCSGALVAIAAAVPAGVGSVIAVNPALHVPRLLHADVTAGELEDVAPPHDGRARRALKRAVPLVPTPVWWAADRVGAFPSRARQLQQLVAHGVDTLLVYGDDDPHYTPLVKTSAWHVRRLQRGPRFGLALVPGLDHGMMLPARRAQVAELMTAHVLARLDPPGGSAPGLRGPARVAGG